MVDAFSLSAFGQICLKNYHVLVSVTECVKDVSKQSVAAGLINYGG